MRLTPEERKQKFFYATEDAEIYDYTVEITQPYFYLMHETMMKLIDFWFQDKNTEITILDIGSGTGIEALKLLNIFPKIKIIAVDFSEPMNTIFRKKMTLKYSKSYINNTISIICEDFLCDSFHPLEALSKISNKSEFDIAMTAFVFQHFGKEEKLKAYRKVFKSLDKNGLFINCDIFGYNNRSIHSYSDNYCLNYLIDQLTVPNINLRECFKKIKERVGDMDKYRKQWENHWKEDNILYPLNCNKPCLSEQKLLKKAGFTDSEIIYRYWLAGIICALKS
ncbi:MAG: class I SAM-dependent methyltransferase [Bacteroidales bacterium]|jgi:ubiquinone/menaquinone biosynthesis C-methylase UbiE|nr:class I SAM-dependent methyltransferase [Bacteroidales bacterium]